MKPFLWKGHSDNDLLYNQDGFNLGYFVGDVAYLSNGFYMGEIYKNEWIGKRSNADYPPGDAHVPHAGITDAPQAARTGLALEDWEDPDF